jgi:hypothetical protein
MTSRPSYQQLQHGDWAAQVRCFGARHQEYWLHLQDVASAVCCLRAIMTQTRGENMQIPVQTMTTAKPGAGNANPVLPVVHVTNKLVKQPIAHYDRDIPSTNKLIEMKTAHQTHLSEPRRPRGHAAVCGRQHPARSQQHSVHE